LAQAGYKSVNDLAAEEDIDRLALKTGLGIRKARHIMEGIKRYLDSEAVILAELQDLARQRQEAAAAAAESAEGEAEAAPAAVAADEDKAAAPKSGVDLDAVDEDW
jgi:hypothetical protein